MVSISSGARRFLAEARDPEILWAMVHGSALFALGWTGLDFLTRGPVGHMLIAMQHAAWFG